MPRGCSNIQNCGRGFCKASIRIAWEQDDWTLPEAANAIGKSPTTLLRCAASLDLPNRARQKQHRPISRSRLHALWHDDSKTLQQIAEELGLSVDAVQHRARAFGFGKRKQGPKPNHKKPDDFADMWRFGVGTQEIARAVGCGQYTVSRWAREAGLPLRYARLRAQTMQEYLRHKALNAVAAKAAHERSAWNAAYGKGSSNYAAA